MFYNNWNSRIVIIAKLKITLLCCYDTIKNKLTHSTLYVYSDFIAKKI